MADLQPAARSRSRTRRIAWSSRGPPTDSARRRAVPSILLTGCSARVTAPAFGQPSEPLPAGLSPTIDPEPEPQGRRGAPGIIPSGSDLGDSPERIERPPVFTFLYNAVRIFAYSLVVLTAVAAGIGRMNPPPPILRTPRPALRVEPDGRRKPSAWNVGYRLKDPATGRLEHFAAPGGHRLNHASCSPWRDSDDRSQLVAQWVSFEGRGNDALPSGSGIARYSIPDGEVLDRVQIESPPTSPPCWYPGTEARVLYAAGDGWLYHYNFDEPGDGPGEVGGNQPRPLAWPDRPPGLERLVFFHPTWPNDPRLRGRLIVALSGLEGSGKGSSSRRRSSGGSSSTRAGRRWKRPVD